MTEPLQDRETHWNTVFATKSFDEVSWFQTNPQISRSLITEFSSPTHSIVDIGAGTSFLVDALLKNGYADVTVLDISHVALDIIKNRIATHSTTSVDFVATNIVNWQPRRTYDLWHDRAVFHFLHDQDRKKYIEIASHAVPLGGVVVLGTFGLDGPEQCSSLPVHRYDSEMIAELFGEGFVLEKSLDEIHQTPFGTTQNFTWTVLRNTGAATA